MSIPPQEPCTSEEPDLSEIPGFTVLGFAIRTSNENEMPGKDGLIGPLWGRFLQGGGDSIPGVLEPHAIYSVYTNYESDETGSYDLILGKIVNPGLPPPAGMTAVAIPTARYRVFPARESSPEAIRSAWHSVYRYFSANGGERRAFTIDFEQYSRYGVALYIAIC